MISVLVVLCAFLVINGAARIVAWLLDYRDSRAEAEFRAAQLLAEAEAQSRQLPLFRSALPMVCLPAGQVATDLVEVSKAMTVIVALVAFAGAGGVSVLYGLSDEVRCHFRSRRRLRRLQRAKAADLEAAVQRLERDWERSDG